MTSISEDLTLVSHEELPATEQGVESTLETEEQGPDVSTSAPASNGHVSNADVHLQDPTVPDNAEDDPQTTQPETLTPRMAPVYYLAKGGPKLKEEAVVITANGQSVIVTPECDDPDVQEKPLREKDLKFLRIFSIVAIVMFFPTGIAAMVFALRAAKRFKQGAERGDMTPARKQCRYCEKLIVASLILGLLSYIFVFAIVEKNTRHHDHLSYHHAYGTG